MQGGSNRQPAITANRLMSDSARLVASTYLHRILRDAGWLDVAGICLLRASVATGSAGSAKGAQMMRVCIGSITIESFTPSAFVLQTLCHTLHTNGNRPLRSQDNTPMTDLGVPCSFKTAAGP